MDFRELEHLNYTVIVGVTIFQVALWVGLYYLIYRLKAKKNTLLTQSTIAAARFSMLMLVYFYLHFILGQLPILPPWDVYSSQILNVTLFIVLTAFSVNIAQETFHLSVEKEQASSIISNLLAIGIWIFGGLFTLNSLGISITPLLTALGVGGLAVALALQDTLTNLFSGLQILLTKQIRPGDYVRLASGEEGTVLDIAWRTTTLKTRSELTIIIPNRNIASTILTNHSWPRQAYFVSISLQVDHNNDLAKVQRVAIEVATQVSLRVSESQLLANQSGARFSNFAESGITLSVSVKARSFNDIGILTDGLIQGIHQRFLIEDIGLSYPVQRILIDTPTKETSPLFPLS